MFKKKTILILCGIGLAADLILFIFQPKSRIDAGIGMLIMGACMFVFYKNKALK